MNRVMTTHKTTYHFSSEKDAQKTWLQLRSVYLVTTFKEGYTD